MFGILYTLAKTGAALVDGAMGVVENKQLKKHAKDLQKEGKNPAGYYLDRYGKQRLIDSDKQVTVDFAINESYGKDVCVRDVHGNVIRNLTDEKREARKEEARDNKRTVYLYNEHGNGVYMGATHRDKGGDGFCEGAQFKDIETGEIYVARRHYICSDKELGPNAPMFSGKVIMYMTLDGKLVRESDSDALKRRRGEIKPSKEMIDAYIEKYNRRPRPHRNVDAFGKINYGRDIRYERELSEYYDNKFSVNSDV